MSERSTMAMVFPGISCALCGDKYAPALHVPVISPEGQARLPRVCENCLSAVLGLSLQLLGHAGRQVAGVVVSMNATGHPPTT